MQGRSRRSVKKILIDLVLKAQSVSVPFALYQWTLVFRNFKYIEIDHFDLLKKYFHAIKIHLAPDCLTGSC
jgi:hypothetical protein